MIEASPIFYMALATLTFGLIFAAIELRTLRRDVARQEASVLNRPRRRR